jgi:hypothetical protein
MLLALVLGLASATDFSEADVPSTEEATPAILPQPPVGQIPKDVLEAAREAARLPLPERMHRISDALLNRPYAIDPLGEGTGIDADPLARYDVFDCLTFTEEVLALALAGDPADAARVRNHLRYGEGPRDYVHRRHFMELQWIPDNIAAGWLVDTTRDYGTPVYMEREVTAETWRSWGSRAQFAHRDEELPVGPMRLTVLPLSTAIEVHKAIRPGSILLTVREDRSWKPIWVSHVGFLIPGKEGPILRHATKMGGGSSRDHTLTWYLNHLTTYANWKVKGIAILEPVDFGPRVTDGPTD